MARYVTTIESTLSPDEAFAYMADFSNAVHWDPSVVEAARSSTGSVGTGSTFELIVGFGGRKLALHYKLVAFDPPNAFVIEANQPSFVSRDTVTVAAAGARSTVHYDAVLEFTGMRRLLGPLMQVMFNRTGERAAAGLRAALNP
jgi:dehydrogenase/reductase SDR family member 12